MRSVVVAATLVLCGAALACASLNPRPIVGILTQPAFEELEKYGAQYINADYVKWLESGGARVVACTCTDAWR